MPALSPTMEEGTLAKWHVKVGDTVKAGDVIAEIETDKATMEVEAVDEGVVEAILVDAGHRERQGQHPDRSAGRRGRKPRAAAGQGRSGRRSAQGRRAGAGRARPGRRRDRRSRQAGPRPPRPTRRPRVRLAAGPSPGLGREPGPEVDRRLRPARPRGQGRRRSSRPRAGRSAAKAAPAAAPPAPRPPPRRAPICRSSSWASPPAATTSSRWTACARPSRAA